MPEQHPGTDDGTSRYRILEFTSTAVMAITAVATAWAGFQAVRWGGVQAERYSEAGGRRVQASMASSAAGQSITIDVGIFLNWVDAVSVGDSLRAKFLRDRFRPTFREAFERWLATEPLKVATPTTPFDRPEYRTPELDRTRTLENEAQALFVEGQSANDRSDSYGFVTVVLASSLFFSGMASQFRRVRPRTLVTTLAGAVCAGGVAALILLPVA